MRPLLALLAAATSTFAADPAPPNVVVILADDLGYGDLGCYGQTKIKTPHLDKLAKDGMRFTAGYAGSTVCAPSRCALMTGLHTGHGKVRGNLAVPLGEKDATVAEMLKAKGYATALVGKWGLGDEGTGGIPTKKGFDTFYGYLNQVHAHNYYPPFLLRNEAREPIPANVPREGVKGVAATKAVYAPDLLLKEALGFVEANKAKPFFLCFATIVPHANNERTKADGDGNEVPSDAPYTNEDWPQPEKNKAAMITRLDADVGTLLAKLDALGLAKNTIVVFSSDNGPHKEGGNDPSFFASSGPYRGIKRALTDGGIRVPFIVRWPAVVKPGSKSDFVTAFWDFLPTVADVVKADPPAGLDGISILPTLSGKEQKPHDHLYWEFHENGFHQAVRFGTWKAIRNGPDQPARLYDLAADVGEATDVAAKHPEVAAKAVALFASSRTDSKEFPIRTGKK